MKELAVLVEAISVIVSTSAILRKYAGGRDGFFKLVENGIWCSDGELVSVRFLSPHDAKAFVEVLEAGGLKYLDGRKSIDIVVADQIQGIAVFCDWAETATALWGVDEKRPIKICIKLPNGSENIVVPPGWDYDRSLTKMGHAARHIPK